MSLTESRAHGRSGPIAGPGVGRHLLIVDDDERIRTLLRRFLVRNGYYVTAARDAAVAKGIVINGLPILNDNPQPFDLPTPVEMVLDRYYTENVIGGPGSFVIPAQDFTDFRSAILSKLIREIAGAPPTPARRLAAAR